MKDSKIGALIVSSVWAPLGGMLAWINYQNYLDARTPGLTTAALAVTWCCAVFALLCVCLVIWIIASELVALVLRQR